MRINFSNNLYHYNNVSNQHKYNKPPVNNVKSGTEYLAAYNDVYFCGKPAQINPDAVESLKQQKKRYGTQFYLYDLKALEGLQNGIKIFEGLSFPQIGYLISNLTSIIVQRGCNNNCLYCFADAKTPYHMKANHYEQKIDFEDYKNLIKGFDKLKKRLDFNPFINKTEPLELFHDADCSMIFLQDKNGKIYDYADLAKMLYDVTERKILFDTAGWNLNDKNTQKRMEDLVQKVASTNKYDFIKFYISVNPFHSIYNKSVELFEQKDYENAKRLREIYTDRTANVIFTFSPLIGKTNSVDKTPQLEFLFRALFNETELEGYQRWNLEMLRKEIYDKLEKMYLDDLKSENPKVVKSEEQLKEYQDYFYENFLYKHIDLVNICNEKLINKLKLNDVSAGEQEIAEKYTFKSANVGKDFQYGKIDLNGKFYMTNYIETYPTDIVLNYKNKKKQTAPIKPNLREDEVITKEMIEKI